LGKTPRESTNEVDAALAYDQAAREYHGDQAQLNFPDLPPQPQAALGTTPRESTNEVDAALAYGQAAREHHEDKAKLNFPDLPPQPQVPWNKPPREASSHYRGKSRCAGV
jgi:hypothetical protein